MARNGAVSALPKPVPRSQAGDPTWEIAFLYPDQGEWSESEYLALKTRRLVEFDQGFIEVLPMPSPLHQAILRFLFLCLDSFVEARNLGRVFFAPLPVRLWRGKYRDPDIAFFRPGRLKNLHEQPHGADLAMEVVSEGEDNRRRDLEIKPKEYAKAGIREYWIVDPENGQITVLKLRGKTYKVHGVFGRGDTATSALLAGFAVAVNEVFDQK